MVPVYACACDVSAAIGWKVGNGKLVLGLTMDAATKNVCQEGNKLCCETFWFVSMQCRMEVFLATVSCSRLPSTCEATNIN